MAPVPSYISRIELVPPRVRVGQRPLQLGEPRQRLCDRLERLFVERRVRDGSFEPSLLVFERFDPGDEALELALLLVRQLLRRRGGVTRAVKPRRARLHTSA